MVWDDSDQEQSHTWQKGAQQVSKNQREAFANDPLKLMTADGSTNGQKSDSDAASWLPQSNVFRCKCVTLQAAVKAKYNFSMTQAEHVAITPVFSSCPDQPVPADSGGETAPVATKEARPSIASRNQRRSRLRDSRHGPFRARRSSSTRTAPTSRPTVRH
ncbi:HNH endonuclease family protein [Arthrobacter sulfonylureivorans]|uniref:HNH endonuclease family protein n=1 Tax=Arthrobacter sulfonylureivorans TaxID=2486855 RepID=A0ABY3WEC3_9MICC|nr:HNH endonuclease family protein [Arthrobacter sulfonylureivorans]UNK47816.1 HNH endonuclease family protein [Arthrobacter sulfonylureivorans]